jgi:hypothetical protein
MSFLEPAESSPDTPQDESGEQSYLRNGSRQTDDALATRPVDPVPHIDREAARALLAALDRWRPPTRLTQPAKPTTEALPLRDAALMLVKDTHEGRALADKLDAFDTLDDRAKQKVAPGIRKDIADIVARAVTEEHQRSALLNALANFRNDHTLPASEPSQRQEQHPCIAELHDVVQDMLEALGKELLIEVLVPGGHILLPPTDFVDSVFTALTMLEIADHPAPVEIEKHPARVEMEDPWHWP